jgi:hypothetical protein
VPFDLGVVGVGEPATHTFVVPNPGSRPLTLAIDRVSPGLRVVRHDSVVAPGAEGRIEVEVNTVALQGPSRLGLSVTTDDPARPALRLALRVEIRPFVVAWPGRARYAVVQRIKDGTVAQTVGAPDGVVFRVVGVEAPHPFLRTSAREARPEERRPDLAGSQWRVELTLPADAPVGALSGFLVIRVDHPRQKVVRVPVSGFVRPLFAVTPPEARLDGVEAGRPARLRLHLKSFAEEPVSILGGYTDVPGVRVEVTPIETGRSYWVGVTIGAEAPPGSLQGTVRLRTDSARQPVVEVPLRGAVRPAGSTSATGGGGG